MTKNTQSSIQSNANLSAVQKIFSLDPAKVTSQGNGIHKITFADKYEALAFEKLLSNYDIKKSPSKKDSSIELRQEDLEHIISLNKGSAFKDTNLIEQSDLFKNRTVIKVTDNDRKPNYIVQFNSESDAKKISEQLNQKYQIQSASGDNKFVGQHLSGDARFGIVLNNDNVNSLTQQLLKEAGEKIRVSEQTVTPPKLKPQEPKIQTTQVKLEPAQSVMQTPLDLSDPEALKVKISIDPKFITNSSPLKMSFANQAARDKFVDTLLNVEGISDHTKNALKDALVKSTDDPKLLTIPYKENITDIGMSLLTRGSSPELNFGDDKINHAFASMIDPDRTNTKEKVRPGVNSNTIQITSLLGNTRNSSIDVTINLNPPSINPQQTETKQASKPQDIEPSKLTAENFKITKETGVKVDKKDGVGQHVVQSKDSIKTQEPQPEKLKSNKEDPKFDKDTQIILKMQKIKGKPSEAQLKAAEALVGEMRKHKDNLKLSIGDKIRATFVDKDKLKTRKAAKAVIKKGKSSNSR